MFDFASLFVKAANIAGGLAFFCAIAFFLRLLYGPNGLWRSSVPEDALPKDIPDGPERQGRRPGRGGSVPEDVRP